MFKKIMAGIGNLKFAQALIIELALFIINMVIVLFSPNSWITIACTTLQMILIIITMFLFRKEIREYNDKIHN